MPETKTFKSKEAFRKNAAYVHMHDIPHHKVVRERKLKSGKLEVTTSKKMVRGKDPPKHRKRKHYRGRGERRQRYHDYIEDLQLVIGIALVIFSVYIISKATPNSIQVSAFGP